MSPYVRFVITVLALVAIAPPASAGIALERAVCSVRLSPGMSEGLGRFGGLVITTKASYAECTDRFAPLQVYMLCSTAATSSSCTVDSRFLYTELALLAVYNALVDARHALDLVDVFFEGVQDNRGQQIRVGSG